MGESVGLLLKCKACGGGRNCRLGGWRPKVGQEAVATQDDGFSGICVLLSETQLE